MPQLASQQPVSIALVVSTSSGLSGLFHTFPEQPVGIVEIRRAVGAMRPTDCQKYCRRHGFKYRQIAPDNLAELQAVFTHWCIDLVVTFSVPILPMHTLAQTKFGALNLHSSLLPAYRGGNPLLWQVMDGVRTTGVSVHCLAEKADTGDVIAQVEIDRPYAIARKNLSHCLHVDTGVPLLRKAITQWVNGSGNVVPQPKISSTAAANHFPLNTLLTKLEKKDASLVELWDVACFLEHWPAEALGVKGWQRWFRWLPLRVEKPCIQCADVPLNEPLSFKKVGARLHLHHADGCLVFTPMFHWVSFLARLLVHR